ncbi:MAG TPA: right-handed parallel beta-helix repeat-containing protein [Kiritimatiellia bacterium]|nr:right-handed parallel beta-helix repeat-containing protein [Kiritimatiellia bacterium]HRU69764.1 right-handed parallel beta-helix repeat-containing protein [Kiritimatiellia bacterium]
MLHKPLYLAACAVVLALVAEGIARHIGGRSLTARLIPIHRYECIRLSGSAASGTVMDAGGGWLNDGKLTELIICSRWNGNAWERPTDITFRNAKLRGSIRIIGMGRNGQSAAVRASSRTAGHTGRAQAAAPTRITIRNVWIESEGRIPIYLAPGVTHVTVEDCVITGRSRSVALYLDAESGQNTIRGNTFAAKVAREAVAVDGSAHNRIERNVFTHIPLGGIYLYRNCGEGGTVRHQTPHDNVLADNRFMTRNLAWRSYGIWLGSRNGRRAYCGCDAGYPFGSSLDDRDFADHNRVTGNRFEPDSARNIRNDGTGNQLDSRP